MNDGSKVDNTTALGVIVDGWVSIKELLRINRSLCAARVRGELLSDDVACEGISKLLAAAERGIELAAENAELREQAIASWDRIGILEGAIRQHRNQKADDRCIEDDDRLYEALGDGIKCDRPTHRELEDRLAKAEALPEAEQQGLRYERRRMQ